MVRVVNGECSECVEGSECVRTIPSSCICTDTLVLNEGERRCGKGYFRFIWRVGLTIF